MSMSADLFTYDDTPMDIAVKRTTDGCLILRLDRFTWFPTDKQLAELRDKLDAYFATAAETAKTGNPGNAAALKDEEVAR